MLTRVKFNVAVRIYPTLSPETQFQLCNPKHREAVEEFYGCDRIRLLTHAIIEVSQDGLNEEFRNWVGLTDAMMVEIKQAMIREGWTPSAEEME